MEQEEKDQIHPLAKKIRENRNSFYISRIPENTKLKFIALAEQDFCGDYGMCLKWLVDDLLNQDTKIIVEKLEEHENRLLQLESNSEKPVEKINHRKMLDGSKKDIRGSK